mmetsp:Transcript_36235/g.104322  ORF Transcript_36235/g.104322 Transcript_36235/m.104322 type:complete len:201 (-) Transcript_36235:368-970(-)
MSSPQSRQSAAPQRWVCLVGQAHDVPALRRNAALPLQLGCGVVLGRWRPLQPEVAEVVLAAYEHGGFLGTIRRGAGAHVADGQADAPVGPAVRLRAVGRLDVVQRELARLHRCTFNAVVVNRPRQSHLLPRPQVPQVAGAEKLQRTRALLHVRECHPGGNYAVKRPQAPVVGVLVPANMSLGARLLDEGSDRPHEYVRAY